MSTPVNRTVNIYINQASAEAAMDKLQKKAESLTRAIDKGRKAGKDMTAEVKRLETTQSAITTLQQQIDGKLAPSFNQVRAHVAALRRELAGMSSDAPGYAAKFKQFEEVSATFRTMQREVNSAGKAMDEFAGRKKGILGFISDFRNQIGAIALGTIVGNGVQSLIAGIGSYISGTIKHNAKLSDSLADIRKVTGMTTEEVAKLNSELGEIDTRTSAANLREIAIGLGRIGQEATPQAVAAIDKIVVALGDDYGAGAEQITTLLGTMRNNLKDIKSEDYGNDMLRIGNAINELGASGLATAPVMTEFANRMAGIAGSFGATSGQILGLAATLQELGVPAERGARAVNSLLQEIASSPEKFAKLTQSIGMTREEFLALVDTDIVAALAKVSEASKIAGADNRAFGKILGDLGADGAGAGEVLSKLAANGELLSEKINLASTALQETGSITEEFNVKNENLAATLEKINKTFHSYITSRTVKEALTSMVMLLQSVLDALPKIVAFVRENAIAIGLWTSAILVNTSAFTRLISWVGTLITGIRGLTAAQVIATLATKADIVATTAAGLAKALFAGNIAKVRQEFQLLKIAMGTNPLGILLIAAGAAAVAIKKLTDNSKELNEQQKQMIEQSRRVFDAAGREVSQLELLKRKTQDLRYSIEERTSAALKLQKLYPEIFGNLTKEQILTGQVADAYDRAAKSIVARAKAKVIEEDLEKNQAQLMELEKTIARVSEKYQIEVQKMSFGDRDLFDPKSIVSKTGMMVFMDPVDDQELIQAVEQYNALLTQQKNLTDDIIETTTQELPEAEDQRISGTIGKLRDQLKQQLEDLKAEYDLLQATDLKGREANLQRQKEIAKQIEALEGKEKKSEISLAQRRKEFLDKVAAVTREATAAAENDDQREIARVQNKFDALRKEAEKLAIYTAQVEADLTAAQEDELNAIFRKQFAEQSNKEYQSSLQALGDYYNQRKQIVMQDYADGKITRQAYSNEIKRLETEEAESRTVIAQDYSVSSKKAAEDAEINKTKALEKGIKEREELEKQGSKERVAAAELSVLTSKKGSLKELNAHKALLSAKFEAETENMDKTSNMYKLKQAELNKALKALDLQYIDEKIKTFSAMISHMSNLVDKFFEFQNTKDQNVLAEERKIHDKKAAALKDQLDKKQISQEQYNARLARLDEQLDKKKKEAEKKAFKRQKAMGILSATISTAQGVARAFADYSWPFSLIVGAIIGAAGAMQIAAIANQKEPNTYAKGRRPVGRGGVPQGPSHAGGGIKLVNSQTGRVEGEMEGDEPILSVATYRNNKPVVDALLDSSMYNNGAPIAPWAYQQPRQLNTRKVSDTLLQNRLYANGGMGPSASRPDPVPVHPASTQYPPELIEALDRLNNRLDEPIKADVYWNDIDRKNREVADLRRAGSLRPYKP